MAFIADLKWRQHRWPCFRSRKHHRRILALTSRLAGLALHVPFWLLLISQHRHCQWRSQWFVQVFPHSVSQSHLLATLTRLLSGFAHVLLTTSISGSTVEGIRKSIFSRSCRHMLEPFCKIFSGRGSVHWMAWMVHSRSLVLARNDLAWVPSILRGRHLLLLGVLRWVFVPQDTLWCWVPCRWGFGWPRLQSWPSCNFELVFPRFHQSEELLEHWISKESFSVLSHFQS